MLREIDKFVIIFFVRACVCVCVCVVTLTSYRAASTNCCNRRIVCTWNAAALDHGAKCLYTNHWCTV